MTTAEDSNNIVRWPSGATGNHKYRIDITAEDEAVVAIARAINDGTSIPGLYNKGGRVVEVAEVDPGTGPKLVVPPVEADRLRRLLAEHTYCYRVKKDKHGEFTESSGLPSVSTARAALAAHEWKGVRQLAGVVTMPIVRPDGTMVTTKGYDPATKLFYWPSYDVPKVPERPSAEQIEKAKGFLFGELLADFPWDCDASRANYVAMLFTPLMRLYIGGLAPLGLISAATRSSGKSLLAEIIEAAYGMHKTVWAKRQEEFEKDVTGILRDTTEPVVLWDNVEVTDTIAHGSLSALLTSRDWSKRVLGVTDRVTCINDRMWIATGNNITVGGDIASRSVLTRLDPQMERPEDRPIESFHIQEDIWQWLSRGENRSRILWSLLVLARAWLAEGAPLASKPMRNFTRWAETMGGLVAFLGIEGFLDNATELSVGADDGETLTAAFVVKWAEKFPNRWVTTKELVASAQVDHFGGHTVDPWGGDFLSKEDRGQTILYTAKGLGRFLAARRDRIYSGYAIRRSETQVENTWRWKVEKIEQ